MTIAVERGSQTDRPRLPWLSRIGTKNGELTAAGMILRGAGALLAIINPVAALVMWLELITLSRTRVRGWWLVCTGALVLIPAVPLGLFASYNLIWRDLGAGVRESLGAFSATNITGGGLDVAPVTATLSAWPSWLLAQLPVGFALGTLVAGLVLGYRARYTASWRQAPSKPAARVLDKAAAAVVRADAVPVDERDVVATADELTFTLGVDQDTAHPFTLTGSALRMHTLIGGPTGFGKSTTLQRIIDQLVTAPLRDPIPVVFIDMKADPEMVAFMADLAATTNRRLHVVTVDPATSVRWNPLRRGGPSEIRSRLIETEEQSATGGFSEPHYRVLGERFLLICAKVLVDLVDNAHQVTVAGRRRPWRQDLTDLLRLMSPQALAREVDRLSPAIASDVEAYLQEVTNNENLARDLYGIFGRYKLWQEGPAGTILTDSPDGLDLYDAIEAGDLVLFSLDAQLDAATARQLGNLALQELTYVQALHGRAGFAEAGRMTFAPVDEFSALGGAQLANMYARMRAAGGAVALASQALYSDLGEVGEGFQGQVLTNANITVLHQQRHEEPARWAEAIGTAPGWKETLQITDDMSVLGSQAAASGVGSLREADSFIVHPNVLRNLPRGHAVVIVGHPERTISTVGVVRAPAHPRPTGTAAPVDLTKPKHVDATPASAPTTTATPAPADVDEPTEIPADLKTVDDEPPAIEPGD